MNGHGSGCVAACYILMLLADTGCALLVTLCFIQTRTLHINVANICNACSSNDGFREQRRLGGELSQSDSLLTHVLVGISGIPWQTLDNKNVENCLVECS